MDKLQMAHEFAMKLIECRATNKTEDIIRLGWEYADAMQAEADKRTTRCNEKIEINMYPEWDATINYPPDAQVMYRGEKRLAVSIKEEWQPDWSDAPDAKYWAIDSSGFADWFSEKPELDDNSFFGNRLRSALQYGYQGNWQESLRKRPQ